MEQIRRRRERARRKLFLAWVRRQVNRDQASGIPSKLGLTRAQGWIERNGPLTYQCLLEQVQEAERERRRKGQPYWAAWHHWLGYYDREERSRRAGIEQPP